MENQAIEPVKHSANQWQKNKYNGAYTISNMVYQMFYYVREEKNRVPISWYVIWSVSLVSPTCEHMITIRDRRYTDKAAMEKYLAGRIKAYSHLFTEISPPIPQALVGYFTVDGQLLPGYTVEGAERGEDPARENSSAMEKLDAAKEATAKCRTLKPAPPKRSHDTEL